MLAVREYKHALYLEHDNTSEVEPSQQDLWDIAGMQPNAVKVTETITEDDAVYVAFRSIFCGRRAYALIQPDAFDMFWTVAGNGTAIKSISSDNGCYNMERIAVSNMREVLGLATKEIAA